MENITSVRILGSGSIGNSSTRSLVKHTTDGISCITEVIFWHIVEHQERVAHGFKDAINALMVYHELKKEMEKAHECYHLDIAKAKFKQLPQS